eukprot:CAMPEP_0206524494 /NCGR_PEP_ID=MMETSP0324_2-20121206/68215_1 /ASSEMBLY_ACC=CAM_ASM_000836 /TAXON_ID=2866 /ORGANISM="Crypthecodinium cohnii, Strain Seligo" /LENGTH=1030 /DNA_ID=CAMNT_0054019067 /DNA_START=115 /DNA_END=3208 /DNA_ORIENTATION=-
MASFLKSLGGAFSSRGGGGGDDLPSMEDPSGGMEARNSSGKKKKSRSKTREMADEFGSGRAQELASDLGTGAGHDDLLPMPGQGHLEEPPANTLSFGRGRGGAGLGGDETPPGMMRTASGSIFPIEDMQGDDDEEMRAAIQASLAQTRDDGGGGDPFEQPPPPRGKRPPGMDLLGGAMGMGASSSSSRRPMQLSPELQEIVDAGDMTRSQAEEIMKADMMDSGGMMMMQPEEPPRRNSSHSQHGRPPPTASVPYVGPSEVLPPPFQTDENPRISSQRPSQRQASHNSDQRPSQPASRSHSHQQLQQQPQAPPSQRSSRMGGDRMPPAGTQSIPPQREFTDERLARNDARQGTRDLEPQRPQERSSKKPSSKSRNPQPADDLDMPGSMGGRPRGQRRGEDAFGDGGHDQQLTAHRGGSDELGAGGSSKKGSANARSRRNRTEPDPQPMQEDGLTGEAAQGRLHLRILRAWNLRNTALGISSKDLSHPFAVATLGNQEFATEVVERSLNPVWNSRPFDFSLDEFGTADGLDADDDVYGYGQQRGELLLEVEVLNAQHLPAKDSLGRLVLPLSGLTSGKKEKRNFPLDEDGAYREDGLHARVELELLYFSAEHVASGRPLIEESNIESITQQTANALEEARSKRNWVPLPTFAHLGPEVFEAPKPDPPKQLDDPASQATSVGGQRRLLGQTSQACRLGQYDYSVAPEYVPHQEEIDKRQWKDDPFYGWRSEIGAPPSPHRRMMIQGGGAGGRLPTHEEEVGKPDIEVWRSDPFHGWLRHGNSSGNLGRGQQSSEQLEEAYQARKIARLPSFRDSNTIRANDRPEYAMMEAGMQQGGGRGWWDDGRGGMEAPAQHHAQKRWHSDAFYGWLPGRGGDNGGLLYGGPGGGAAALGRPLPTPQRDPRLPNFPTNPALQGLNEGRGLGVEDGGAYDEVSPERKPPPRQHGGSKTKAKPLQEYPPDNLDMDMDMDPAWARSVLACSKTLSMQAGKSHRPKAAIQPEKGVRDARDAKAVLVVAADMEGALIRLQSEPKIG